MTTQPTYGRVIDGRMVPMTLAEFLASGPLGRVARVREVKVPR